MSENKICCLDSCTGEITGIRKDRGYRTCSKECAYINNINTMTLYRAKKRNLKTTLCATKGCDRIFTKTRTGQKRCRTCLHRPFGRPPGRKEVRAEAPGKPCSDFRKTICSRPKGGGLCRHYSRCSDTLMVHKNGAFKFQVNGGKDCWEIADD